ncbi:MAG: hypothetical protein A3F09_02815 [Chlamydiae bacterium RIFCSPHIGHO2_12_FULL_49_11]|nr:MAG: hypothetical protein A3F09_02815 [Chlamydiae bacterium RIFCSPHIGHO2_12_FULL_49_11]
MEAASFTLASGVHSYVRAVYDGKWILIGGRTNGLHGFQDSGNFPASSQNDLVQVVDPSTGTVWSRLLTDPSSGLTPEQIYTLNVTAAQGFQDSDMLYMIGGYGYDPGRNENSTKSTLSVIRLPGLIKWVMNTDPSETFANNLRQTTHPLLKVAGGHLTRVNKHKPVLLIFGQDFDGNYLVSSNGAYTQQVRAFHVIDNGKSLYIKPCPIEAPNANYRRRDFPVGPIISQNGKALDPSVVVWAGVFTTIGDGYWTVPVSILPHGVTAMADPNGSTTFRQGMNIYNAATSGLFSKSERAMYQIFFGGISYVTVSDSMFSTDSEFPFINTVTATRIDKSGSVTQHLLSSFPTILQTTVFPGQPFLFGAEAWFFPASGVQLFPSGVISLDDLGAGPVVVGYVVGGIQSRVPNTSSMSESAASAFVFRVTVEKN